MEITWKEPPPSEKRRNVSTKKFVEKLKENPGEWALYPGTVSASTTIYQYQRNHPGTEWESRPSEDEEGRYQLYARWIGEES